MLHVPPNDNYYPCNVINDVFWLNAAARVIKNEFGALLTALKFDKVLTIAANMIKYKDPDYVIQLCNAIDVIKDSSRRCQLKRRIL